MHTELTSSLFYRIFTDGIVEKAKKLGYVETISGRRRLLPKIFSRIASEVHQAERQAVNTTIQGSAADITKTAMVEINQCMSLLGDKDKNFNSVSLKLHIHDELIYEVPFGILKKFSRILQNSMECCMNLSVPLNVKIKCGTSWNNLCEIDIDNTHV